MKKLVAAILMLSAAGACAADPDPILEKYAKSCQVCHANGAANAPRAGDAAAWEPRLAKGIDTLVQSVTNGLNAMPPRGMCFECTADDYKALIEYMSTPAQ